MAQAMLAANLAKRKVIDMGKYERMKRIGMPLPSILNKMRLDGVSDDVVAQWGGGGNKNKTDNNQLEKNIMEINPGAKMKPLHWAKFTQFQTDGTVWEGVDKVITQYKVNYEELEQLFQQYQKGGNTQQKQAKPKKEEKKDEEDTDFQLIDPKRSQNVMIVLARMGLSEDEILEAILKMDDKKLPPEKVRKLIPFVPTDAELQMVREYVKNGGDVSKLGNVERFFVKMMDLVDIKSRLNLWLFKSEFPTVIAAVKERIDIVNQAISELMSNNALKDVFTILLAIGNYMNANTTRGNAYGFHLEPTLDMLEGMKGTDKKTSLMMYVVKTCQDCKPDSLKWVQDLDILPNARKVMTDNLQKDVDSLRRDMDEIEKKHKAQKRTLTRTHIDWARDGAAVPLNQIASHFRVVSRTQPPEIAMEEFATYKTLRSPVRPGIGNPGKIGGIGGMAAGGGGGNAPHHMKNDSMASNVGDDGNDDVENMFGKLMLQFYKRANATVREVETNLKQLSQNTKKLCQYFGVDESTKSEEVLSIFAEFRERFIKGMSELDIIAAKAKRKEMQNANQQMLAQRLANRPKQEDVTGKYAVDMDNADNSNAGAAGGKAGAGNAKTKEMYKKYLQKKKGDKEDDPKQNLWL